VSAITNVNAIVNVDLTATTAAEKGLEAVRVSIVTVTFER
jgi:hypothetical protein